MFINKNSVLKHRQMIQHNFAQQSVTYSLDSRDNTVSILCRSDDKYLIITVFITTLTIIVITNLITKYILKNKQPDEISLLVVNTR